MMLVKRGWDEIMQGDMVYVPAMKLRGIVALPHERLVGCDGREVYLPAHVVVMRYEDVIPWFVSLRGAEGGVRWVRVD